ncbi:MAG TPA: phosphatase PAP2 family protein [Steroidobacteraceae bacterium]|jgi:lipid A 4'-phosphatase
MQYLRLKRSRLIIGTFLVFSLLAVAFPGMDLQVSAMFYDGRSFLRDQWWQRLLQDGLGYFLGTSLAIAGFLYLRNKLSGRAGYLVDGRKIAYLLLVLIVGAGLIVNAGFKNNLGRARPRDVAQFGGARVFTPAFVPSNQCDTNCSFSSGDSAAAFFSLALVMAFRRRRRWLLVAIALGVVVSLARISAGAHFFSDTVVSFFVMLLVADALYYYVVLNQAGRERAQSRRHRLFGVAGATSA